jgi:uncharacterized protein YjbI with pentapeptide repeats
VRTAPKPARQPRAERRHASEFNEGTASWNEWRRSNPTVSPALGGARNLKNDFLIGANLSRTNLSGTNLIGANLIGANLIGANLPHANLRDANLRDANLRGADLGGADLIGANLSGAPAAEPRQDCIL